MSFVEIMALAVALSMDAFAVAICKGLAMEKLTFGKAAVVGGWFGAFQALMPLLGYFMGVQFAAYVSRVDHWIAFILLVFIGGNMIRESRSKDADENTDADLSFKTMLAMAVATSIDALAVGVTFAFLEENTPWMGIFPAVILIGCTTFVISAVGVKIGSIFGTKYKSKAEFVGGLILCALGIKILIEAFISGV